MLLGYFTEEAYEQLLNDIALNSEKYSGTEEWLPEYFGNANSYYNISKTVDVSKFLPSYTPGKKSDEQKCMEDLMNTRLLYDAFKSLSPLQASNKYMWTYLCHAIPEYREYIKDRWLQEERENTIKSRFFVTSSGSLLNDNALSRLWWYGYLTYDPDNSNHYALTEILLTNQTICTDVMDTFNRMNLTRMKGVLLAIKQFKDELDSGEGITEYFRECKKFLNHYGAVTTLELLSVEEIQKLAYDYMVKLRDAKVSKNRKKGS